MAAETPIKPSDNWFKDEDKTFRYFVTTGEDIVISATAEEGATSITVEPLKETIATASKVRFGNIVVTLSAESQAGDVALNVSAITGILRKGQVGRKCQDVTSWTFAWVLKGFPDGDAVLTITPAIITASEGVVDAVIADTDTHTLAAKKYWYSLRRTNAGNESMLAYGEAVLKAT